MEAQVSIIPVLRRPLTGISAVALVASALVAIGVTPAHATCGGTRWTVKTGADPDAASIDAGSPTATTIASLASLVPPDPLPDGTRVQPTETTVFRLAASLTGYQHTDDQDYLLVLTDGGQTMTAHVPDPSCVDPTSPLLAAISNARSQIDDRYTPSDRLTPVDVPVTVTGVGFFSTDPRQPGDAPNGIQLHPLLDISFATPPAAAGDRFAPVTPTRVLDTRTGLGLPAGRAARVPPRGTVNLQLAGVAGVAADADAVVVNVTGVGATASTYLSVYPTTTNGPPTVSNLNLAPRATVANLVTVKVGDGGEVTVRNAAGDVDVVADVAGYYAPDAASTFTPLTPIRTLDTRLGLGAAKVPVGAEGFIDLQVANAGGVPADAQAVVLNLTATRGTASTYVQAYPTPASGTVAPTVSNLNVPAGRTVANLVTVKVGDLGRVRLRNHSGAVDLVADVAGYFSTDRTGSTYTPLPPVRLLDTRTGQGEPGGAGVRAGPGGLIDLRVAGIGGVPANATAAVFNLTAVNPTVSTYLQAYPTPSTGLAVPTVSNVNVPAGAVVPNLVTVVVGAGGAVRLRNAVGTTDMLADLAGYYSYRDAPGHPPAPATPRVQGVTAAVTMSNPRPVQYGTVYANVMTTPGAAVTAIAYFTSGAVSRTATADGTGRATLPFTVGGSPPGVAVAVRVSVSDPNYLASATATASFTPAALVGTAATTPLSGTAAVNGPVYAATIVGNILVVGGRFSSVAGQPRANLAALDATTGALLPWRADTNGTVSALGGVYGMIAVGGSFTSIAGQPRSYVAVITTTGSLRPFSVRPDAPVLAVTGYGTTLFFGGQFMTVNGYRLRHLASADVASGALHPSWTPNPDGRITALAVWSPATLLVGGNYTAIGGLSRPNLAGVALSGSGAAWRSMSFATTGCPVFAIAARYTADRIVVACAGWSNGGNRFEAFDHAGGAAKWIHYADGNAQAVVIVGSTVYCGGHFALIDKLPRKHIAAADLVGGALKPWSVTMNSALGVWAEAATVSRLWLAGEFTLLQDHPLQRVGGFPITG